ncbi:unnamed protein product [Clonostachys rosea f. rosea IK726]|uniref:Uncharacterized protein n=1 Tax=Clonostachys rosea f. rosea IK726 TaxID=1349383 RepID=A0ACA9TEB4_BIOOC|nr:unnamed protein product [Clonostachys rosea f. rosea IK726]
MAASPLTFRVAMLNADEPMPNVVKERGSYGNIFHNLLKLAAERVAPNVTIEAEDFDVVSLQYPSSPSDFDALLVTGSASSSYDDKEWTKRLDRYLLDVYDNYPHSILRKYGVKVIKSPVGWEFGVHEISLTPAFSKALSQPNQLSADSLRLQFIHSDRVELPSPDALSDTPWILMGSTPKCPVQGVYEPGRVLTYQGHFEFDQFVNSETVRVFCATWGPKEVEEILEAVDQDDDSEAAAQMVVKFFLEGRQAVQGLGGLMTPPI